MSSQCSGNICTSKTNYKYSNMTDTEPLQTAIREAVTRYMDNPFVKRKDFIFQKAKDDLDRIRQLPPEQVHQLYEGYLASGGTYEDYVRSLPETSNLRAVGDLLGQFISYCDEKASGARFWNPERIFLAKASIRQPYWIKHIWRYIANNGDTSSIANGVGNIIRYLENPSNEIPITDKSKQLFIAEHILQKPYSSTEFAGDIKQLFAENGLQTAHPDNFTYCANCILFGELESRWRGTPRFWRLGTTEDEKSVWPEMRNNQIASIGWNDLGDLDQKGMTKEIIKDKLASKEYNYTKSVLSSKAREICDFISTATSEDFVVAMDGQQIKGIGKICGDYNYGPDLPTFWHNRSVEWLVVEGAFPVLAEGLRTTFVELKKQASRDLIRSLLNDFPMSNVNNSSAVNSLNAILYGPPGTGKTYQSIDHALAIIENSPVAKIAREREENPQEVKRRFEELKLQGRIDFCTFHQNMGYEDFIEGIKPLAPIENKPMQYAVVDGIFKRMCTKATFALATQTHSTPTDQVIDFSYVYDQFVSDAQERLSRGENITLGTVSGGTMMVESISDRNNLVLKHQGSENTYIVSKERLGRLAQALPDLKQVRNIDSKFREVIGGSNATAYWAVLNALRNQEVSETRPANDVATIGYEDKKIAIKGFQYRRNQEEQMPPFVLIIDEINRGNVAQIFGELITLIEDDKRMGENMALDVILPYSKENFSVPPNLHVIGTMNTADRSVEALDTALRRRFSFKHMKPDHNKLSDNVEGVNVRRMLEVINQRLEVLIDADHTIGHAWLWDVTGLEGLKKAFRDKIIPLLQEFFYNDYEKIGLVLGKAFVDCKTAKDYVQFAPFKNDSDLSSSYSDKTIYTLKEIDETCGAEVFVAIYPT